MRRGFPAAAAASAIFAIFAAAGAILTIVAAVTPVASARAPGRPSGGVAAAWRTGPPPASFAAAGEAAAATLERAFYRSPGAWHACLPAAACGAVADDWGADSLTGALFFRWRTAHDSSVVPLLRALGRTLPDYSRCARRRCPSWSDIPLWDAVAAARIYEATRDRRALANARSAFAFEAGSRAFALGACPLIDFQRPGGKPTALKTLETDSNYIRAALLLARWTAEPAYVRAAQAKYAAVRRYYLDPAVPLYSAYVFDDGARCRQLPRRFFASVNGNMIAAGLTLAAITHNPAYRREALATAHAVAARLDDGAGVYADLQADNDVAGPLVEAMSDVAKAQDAKFARRWLRAAAAAVRPAASGAYGRFFDGPPPAGPISAWSADGGLELAIAAAALDPGGSGAGPADWRRARFIARRIRGAPAAIAFSGRGIALIGSIGAVCCEFGHVRVFIDGRETVDATGIWQNKSPASRTLPNSVLFAYRWPASGRHVVVLQPGGFNPKEGASFVDLAGYDVLP